MRLSAATALAVCVVLAPGVPAAAGDQPAEGVACAEIDGSTDGSYETSAVSAPMQLLGIDAAHAIFPDDDLPGSGVRVAVVDSGVHAGSPLLDVEPGYGATAADPAYFHGTAVAGLVAGKPRDGLTTGVAPGATIVDVRVYGDEDTQDPSADVEPGDVHAGLDWLVEEARDGRIDVAVIALRLPESRRLASLVRGLHEQDVVVVAAAGNRPDLETDPLFPDYGGGPRPGEDAAAVIHPAAYEHVVAVSATGHGHPEAVPGEGHDQRATVLQSSAIDVAVPTYGGVSLAVNGSTCLLPDVATSWAAAEVAGVVALLRDRFPEESAEQVVARLVRTASGSPDDDNRLTGAGIVQPVEALTRPLTPDRTGRLDGTVPAERDIPPATAPASEADVLATAREQAVWWGLLAGGALVLGLVLRPVLARRARG